MVESKGVSFLVDLWRQPSLSRTQLVMAGEGALMQRLKGRLPANVRWVGHVEGADKHRLLADCRAVVIPSLWPEPLGLVCYEAYELGKPVLASRCGGLAEVVADAETGRLLTPGSYSDWTKAILEVDGNATLAKRWGEQGRRWLEEKTSPAQWNDRFNRLLERVFASQHAVSP
jgi:glycosyltransferase involved in cell wall biosynthesis